MTIKTLLNALDTIVDKVEFYHGDYIYDYALDEYHALMMKGRVKKFRVYESEDTVILMVIM